MEDIFLQVYSILSKIDNLSAKIYKDLSSKYGRELVNSVIDKMIEDDEKNILKFEYYISKFVAKDSSDVFIGFDAYLSSLNSLPINSAEDNIRLLEEIHQIVLELEEVINQFECYKNFNSWGMELWIADKVDYCTRNSNDMELLKKLNSLYKKFIEKRNIIANQNLRLVITFAKRYCKAKITMDELVQIGNMGIMRAIEKFDPSYNSSFSTYAYYWVKNALNRGLGEICYFLRVPYDGVVMNQKMLQAIDHLKCINGSYPTDQELASYMGVTVAAVEKLRNVFVGAVSLDEKVNFFDDMDSCSTYLDYLDDPSSSVFESIEPSFLHDDLITSMRNNLNDSEMTVLMMRYGFYDGELWSLEAIGHYLGLSKERIRQIEIKAKKKIKTNCGELQMYLT